MRWAFWRWTTIPQSKDYITRLHLVKTPWFAVCLHWINRPDPEPYLHDHPVTFLSIVLKGGYSEMRAGLLHWGVVVHHVNWWNYLRASIGDCHTIVDVPWPTLTLCFMGPKRREWGYHMPQGWKYWRDYYAERNSVIGEQGE